MNQISASTFTAGKKSSTAIYLSSQGLRFITGFRWTIVHNFTYSFRNCSALYKLSLDPFKFYITIVGNTRLQSLYGYKILQSLGIFTSGNGALYTQMLKIVY